MKLAIAGKGGAGKTSLAVWLGDYLARTGTDVWLVDADTALSLGPALGLQEEEVPDPLVQKKDLIEERVGAGGFIDMNPKVDDLINLLGKDVRGMHLLVMGTIVGAGGGCGCPANALLKAVLLRLSLKASQCLLVDLEAGVEHLGRGTIANVDGLIIISEPSMRSLQTASRIGALAWDLGLKNQRLVLNRSSNTFQPESGLQLPPLAARIPPLNNLAEKQQYSSSVLDLPDRDYLDSVCANIVESLKD